MPAQTTMTIADRILSVRRQIPDMPSVMPPPAASVGSLAGGGQLPAGTYYAVVTQFNLYGESLGTAELGPMTVVANGVFNLSIVYHPNAVVIRVYFTLPNGGSGSECLYQDYSLTAIPYMLPLTVTIQGLTESSTGIPTPTGLPPTRSTAWLPSADGKAFSASALYQWLSDALNKLSHAVNGIQDYCGVPTLSGQPLYKVPGQWLTISDTWYGGYWIQGGQRQWFYRRNAIQSQVLDSVTVSVQTDKQVIEIFPQPDRSSGVTTTTAELPPDGTTASIVTTSVFLLPFGFAMLSGVVPLVGQTSEIVAYSNLSGTHMSGLVRGLGNTTPQDWPPNSTTVTELSLFWCGKRIFDTPYSTVPQFQAQGGVVVPPDPPETTIPVPYGWGPILDKYMLAQAKLAEQDVETGQAMEKAALADAVRWANGNRGVNQFVQVGGANALATFDNTIAGGLVVP